MVKGRFLEFCDRARTRTGRCVLIIDEFNRANLARVFGELMYLLEYREDEVPLAGGNKLSIPKNVVLIGTMNTADRSIALVDHALRRRFAFIALPPNFDALRTYHEKTGNGFKPDRLIEQIKRINTEIKDPNFALGVSFFMREDVAGMLPDIWRTEIEPYLEEYFFDRPKDVDALRWDAIGSQILGA
jgi:5-methylcytosine-specific restriction protein B